MPTFEYAVYYFPTVTVDFGNGTAWKFETNSVADNLNRLGKDGWEVVSVINHMIVLKREKTRTRRAKH